MKIITLLIAAITCILGCSTTTSRVIIPITETNRNILPNDYGQTGGENLGLNANLSYLDFLEVKNAWQYTTGRKDIKIGISDGYIDPSNPEFSSKLLDLSPNSKGSTVHGNSVAAIAAAQGNNAYGITGVCQDCDIVRVSHNNYKKLEEAFDAGARILNCSWGVTGFSQENQDIITRLYEKGAIIVASSHNKAWSVNKGNVLYYPASYEHVISVGSVGHRFESVYDSIHGYDGAKRGYNIKDHVGTSTRLIRLPELEHKTTPLKIDKNSTSVMNSAVDILAPGSQIIQFGDYVKSGKTYGYNYMHTSVTPPQVSGTIGLMLSLNSCLSFENVESILKLTSRNIDAIEANQPFKGNYGSGSLNAGDAVMLTEALSNPNKIAVIQNQNFNRWPFEISGVSKDIVIKNQTFKDDSSLKLVSKNKITLEPGTLLKPNDNGSILLSINPNLSIANECRTTAHGYKNGQ